MPPTLPYHEHAGNDGSPKLNPKNFLGFPILTEIPTDQALEGTIVLVLIAGSPDTYFAYAMIDRVWRGVEFNL